MMNKLLVFLFLSSQLFSIKSHGQSPYRGLIAYSYSETTKNGDTKIVRKPIYIVYNDEYCELLINGFTTNFAVDGYTQELDHGYVKESFLSGETETIPRGWYSIEIVHNKNGKSDVTINLPLTQGGKAYFLTGAQNYSKHGRVEGRVYVKDWREIQKNMKLNDSVARANQLQLKQNVIMKRIADSLRVINDRNAQLVKEDSILNLGHTYYFADTRTVQKAIDSALRLQITDKYIYGNINLFIDKSGLVKSCTLGSPADNIGTVIPQINTILAELKLSVKPYTKNGINYPSYSDVMILIKPHKGT